MQFKYLIRWAYVGKFLKYCKDCTRINDSAPVYIHRHDKTRRSSRHHKWRYAIIGSNLRTVLPYNFSKYSPLTRTHFSWRRTQSLNVLEYHSWLNDDSMHWMAPLNSSRLSKRLPLNYFFNFGNKPKSHRERSGVNGGSLSILLQAGFEWSAVCPGHGEHVHCLGEEFNFQ
jgi:hypothetical protein